MGLGLAIIVYIKRLVDINKTSVLLKNYLQNRILNGYSHLATLQTLRVLTTLPTQKTWSYSSKLQS